MFTGSQKCLELHEKNRKVAQVYGNGFLSCRRSREELLSIGSHLLEILRFSAVFSQSPYIPMLYSLLLNLLLSDQGIISQSGVRCLQSLSSWFTMCLLLYTSEIIHENAELSMHIVPINWWSFYGCPNYNIMLEFWCCIKQYWVKRKPQRNGEWNAVPDRQIGQYEYCNCTVDLSTFEKHNFYGICGNTFWSLILMQTASGVWPWEEKPALRQSSLRTAFYLHVEWYESVYTLRCTVVWLLLLFFTADVQFCITRTSAWVQSAWIFLAQTLSRILFGEKIWYLTL